MGYIQPLILCLNLLLINMGFGIIIPVLTALFFDEQSSLLPLETSYFARHLYYSLSFIVYAIGALIANPIWGFLSDQYGRKK